MKFYPVVIGFSAIDNPEERRYFMEQPTTFFLPSQAIDRIRDVGGRLLREAKVYQEFLADLHPPLAH